MAELDIYLKIDGIPGDSRARAHAGEIELIDFAWGLTNAGAGHVGSGAGAGRADFSPFIAHALTSSASPLLMLRTADGKHLPTAVVSIDHRGASRTPAARLDFADVTISGYQTVSDGRGPTDTISITYSKITYTEFQANPTGGPPTVSRVTWNVKTNAPA